MEANLMNFEQGKLHHFGTQHKDDYHETIAQGADTQIYGRYKDVENIGSDIADFNMQMGMFRTFSDKEESMKVRASTIGKKADV